MTKQTLKDNSVEQRVAAVLQAEPQVLRGDLSGLVAKMLKKRARLLNIAEKHGTPCYIFDHEELSKSVNDYLKAFSESVPESRHFYAMKLNHYPELVKTVVQLGMGIDVSSGRELALALKHGAQQILFSGPGKTSEEIELALNNSAITTLNMDSAGEIERIADIAGNKGGRIRAGLRVFSDRQGAWNKFGVPLTDLKTLWDKTREYPGIELRGIQFHMSWNRDAEPYVQMIEELADYLRTNFSPAERSEIEFIDIGGGFRPYLSEGYFPWKLLRGGLERLLAQAEGRQAEFQDRYYLTEAIPISDYAAAIGKAIDSSLRPLLNCTYYTEPGRIIANNALHILLSIVDVKRPGCAIADGGINLVGWERFEYDYFPLINLTQPSDTRELESTIFGPLCMPQDMWGYFVYGEGVAEGDYILVPYQGALTYSLAQEFIKPIAPVHALPECAK